MVVAVTFVINGMKFKSLPPGWGPGEKSKAAKRRARVGKVVMDGKWHTLAEISEKTGDPEASVSARLRDFRKSKFGGFDVVHEKMPDGLFRYRVVVQ